MVHVLECGSSNSGSILNMLKKLGADAKLCSESDDLDSASHIILPGIGHFDACVNSIRERGWDHALKESVRQGAHLLGICVGLQLLFEKSEEGSQAGLGLIPGSVRKLQLASGLGLKVPHMGWNTIQHGPDKLFAGLSEEARFYFVHSYYVDCPKEFSIASCEYGSPFVCAARDKRVCGVQFHPEKSHKFGLQLLRNFVEAA